MKLPIKAHRADTSNVAGIKTEVATITGLTNIRRRNMCAYDTTALRAMRMVSKGTVCRRVVYGKVTFGLFVGLRVRKRIRMELKKHMLNPAHQAAVHLWSLYFRRPRGTYRGSGNENTSTGRVCPSRGRSDSVSESVGLVRGGGCGCG